jgi:hypothetical protein
MEAGLSFAARKLLVWAGVTGMLAVGAGAAAAAPRAASCSTHGLSSAGLKVVAIHAQGMTCASARSIAARVARDLAHGAAVSVPGAAGFAMSQQSCTGCKTTTSISITYPRGKVTLNITGGSGSTGPTRGARPETPG